MSDHAPDPGMLRHLQRDCIDMNSPGTAFSLHNVRDVVAMPPRHESPPGINPGRSNPVARSTFPRSVPI